MVKISDIKKRPLLSDSQQEVSGSHGWGNHFSLNKRAGKFSDTFKERFFSELSILMASGIDMHSALGLIKDGAQKYQEQTMFNLISKLIIEGKSLYEALIQTSKFSSYDTASIRIGEETGQLAEILVELSNYYARKIKQKRLVLKAISYPIVVLFTAIGSLVFMLSYVVPMFEDIFFRSNKELPVFTQYIIKLSKFFREDIIYVVVVMILLGGLLMLFRRSVRMKRVIGRFLFKIPLIGVPLQMYFMEKLYHSLTILIKAKVPVHDALFLVRNIISSYTVQAVLLQVWNDVMKGHSLADAMKHTAFFDKKAIVLIKIGEEVNKLDDIFEKLYHQTSDRMEHLISQLGNTLEPLLIILVGGLVALILVAMYLPIFQVGTSVF